MTMASMASLIPRTSLSFFFFFKILAFILFMIFGIVGFYDCYDYICVNLHTVPLFYLTFFILFTDFPKLPSVYQTVTL